MESDPDPEIEEDTIDQLQHSKVDLEGCSKQKSNKRHKQSHVGIYSCNQCEFTGSKSGLWSHKKSIHVGLRYPCDQCEYAATHLSNLKEHKKSIHEGVQYPCNQCGLSYTKAASLKQHKKTIHEGIRYLCDQCEHVASTLSTLRYHKKTKHGGVRYPCSECEYAATQYCDLNKHTKLKHSLDSLTVIKTKKARVSKYQKSQNKHENADAVLLESSNISEVETEIKEEGNI